MVTQSVQYYFTINNRVNIRYLKMYLVPSAEIPQQNPSSWHPAACIGSVNNDATVRGYTVHLRLDITTPSESREDL